MRCFSFAMLWALVIGAGVLAAAGAAQAVDSAAVKAIFADPPRQYSTAPLWTWNDMLTDEQVIDSLRDLAGQQVKQAFVHPRPGLMTPYLSADWFRLWKAALGEAERLDMNLWIYDENSYPSGFAGGLVPEAMPESRGRGLHLTEVKRPGKLADDALALFRLSDNGYEDVTAQARKGESLPQGRYLQATIRRAPVSPWHAGKYYVDLLYPGVTQKFLDITLEAYRREIGDQFGKRVPGSFTDEPQLRPAGGLPWTADLPEQFQRRWGYSLSDNLPSLVRPLGDWKRLRHNYFQLVLELFIERWAKPYHDYCEKHGLEFTGHYWEHDWPNCISVPDNMALYAWHQRPAIDCLMNEYGEQTHSQFGNIRMVKELSSVANQLGRKRTLCEAYGAGGWDLRFEDMKRIGDWLYVLGVNTLDEHISYVTIRGARKWDHPQSFSYHEPWWEGYHVLAQYFTRLSAVMSQGEQINRVLLIEPTTTAWMYQGDPSQAEHLKKIGDEFQEVINAFEREHIEYDVASEDIIARHGSIQFTGGAVDAPRACFCIGKRSYEAVLLSPLMENVNGKTMDLLEGYAKGRGKILSFGPPPQFVDGRPSDRGPLTAKMHTWEEINWLRLKAIVRDIAPPAPRTDAAKKISAWLDTHDPNFIKIRAWLDTQNPDFKKRFSSVRGTQSFPMRNQLRSVEHFFGSFDIQAEGRLLHHRRRLDDGDILFLVNTSIDSWTFGSVKLAVEGRGGGVEQWDLMTGAATTYSNPLCFFLPPCGSLVLFLPDNGRTIVDQTPFKKPVAISPTNLPEVRRVEPNVLTLDYFDVTAGGETKKNVHCYRACEFAFKKNGMPGNPWNHAVQFRDELISKKFPADSGCEATYHFTIEGEVPKPLWIVIERPDLYQITCNGQPVRHAEGDRSMFSANASLAKTGLSAEKWTSPQPSPRPLPEGEGTKDWWLDKSFGRIDITAAAKVGENAVTIKAAPFTVYHELMPAYVLGDFGLKPVESGFVIVPAEPLKLGKWNEQGHPFYATGVSYTQTFAIPQPTGKYRVRLPDGGWYGSVAKVVVNGKPAGYIGWAPWQCDVTEQLRPGSNTVEIIVIGTLKNTLGPHHAGRVVGRAWPTAFQAGPETGPPPGEKYHTLGYGLFKPFELQQVSSEAK